MVDQIPVDPNLKILIDANSTALSVLLSKIASGEPGLSEEIAKVQATDSDLKSAVSGTPVVDMPAPPPAA